MIVNAFQSLGMCLSGGMGANPLTWSEIDSFCRRSTFDLEDWQCETVINMSRNYLAWRNKGKDLFCPSPWDNRESLKNEEYQDSLIKTAKATFRR